MHVCACVLLDSDTPDTVAMCAGKGKCILVGLYAYMYVCVCVCVLLDSDTPDAVALRTYIHIYIHTHTHLHT